MIGVALAGLRTSVLPAARAGASFQAAMSSGKFHGHDLGADADRFAQGVIEQRTVHRDLLAPELGGETGVVLEAVGGCGDVAAGLDDDLAAVDRLDPSNLVDPLAQDVRDPVQDSSSLQRRHAGPRSIVERLPGGGDRSIDVRNSCLRDAADDGVGRRADRRERFTAGGGDALPPDEERIALFRCTRRCHRSSIPDAAVASVPIVCG